MLLRIGIQAPKQSRRFGIAQFDGAYQAQDIVSMILKVLKIYLKVRANFIALFPVCAGFVDGI